MIIKCEECESRFNLDESLLKNGGSKVRCSVCKNVFTAFPPEPATDSDLDMALEETAVLDFPPDLEGIGPESAEEDEENALDDILEDAREIEEAEAPPAMAEEKRTNILLEESEVDVTAPAAAPFRKRPGRSMILRLTMVIILMLLLGSLIVFILTPGLLPDSLSILKPIKKEDIVDTGIRRLAFKGVSGDFLQTDKTGQLFVIKGTVINNNPKSRSFLLLKGTILDEKGESIIQKLVYAGNTFTDKQLNDMRLEEIDRDLKNQAGKGNINIDVEPGGSVPFMIIFENLPDNGSEFIVEAVSSSPGK